MEERMKGMKTINLPEVVDRTVATGLALELSDALGGGPGVVIEASKVRQIGQCGLQLLVSAAVTAVRREQAFSVEQPSEAFAGAVRIAGLQRHLSGHAVQAL